MLTNWLSVGWSTHSVGKLDWRTAGRYSTKTPTRHETLIISVGSANGKEGISRWFSMDVQSEKKWYCTTNSTRLQRRYFWRFSEISRHFTFVNLNISLHLFFLLFFNSHFFIPHISLRLIKVFTNSIVTSLSSCCFYKMERSDAVTCWSGTSPILAPFSFCGCRSSAYPSLWQPSN